MDRTRFSLSALRALSGVFLLRLLRPVFLMTAILLVASYTLVIMLSLSFSTAWLLLLIVLVPLTIIVGGVGFLLWFLVGRILPRKLNRDEQRQIGSFVDKLLGIAERSRTPYPIMVFLVAKDVLRGKDSSFLKGLIGDSQSLVREYASIQEMFRS